MESVRQAAREVARQIPHLDILINNAAIYPHRPVLPLEQGEWHDFEGFAHTLEPVLAQRDYQIEVAWEPARLLRLKEDGWDGVIAYTCFTTNEGKGAVSGLTQEQVAALTRWVRTGGGFLALHAATVVGSSGEAYRALLGGEFQSHPPPFSFTVYPLSHAHPILTGITAFTIYDEFYLQQYDRAVTVHLIALYQNMAYPVAWSKVEGRGRVAYLAPGHFQTVWENPMYQRLVQQALEWVLKVLP